jgi:hypothetical protein
MPIAPAIRKIGKGLLFLLLRTVVQFKVTTFDCFSLLKKRQPREVWGAASFDFSSSISSLSFLFSLSKEEIFLFKRSLINRSRSTSSTNSW